MFEEFPKAVYLTHGQPRIVESAEHEAALLGNKPDYQFTIEPGVHVVTYPDAASGDVVSVSAPPRRGRPPKSRPE